ncbi:AAA family ATPase [Algoriphagus sp. NBT04N3]|jgi:putative ATP-dependent endonuclease of the OLD family|uniref:ATP-dependent nuclease n=1 Tax=Algoriphagus sp. NBT04N3 TaxID=2705473 RepID=UPI001C624903|nr:AAA family ATPase [Algoriphagus sp. NBT04N3]QYH37620.1 AAA family ATPase [Algoriphagus sp. NBT04N3]
MHIQKVIIENYKCFKGRFNLPLTKDVNIIVGNNETGKSTIIEAIHLCLTGLMNGRHLRNHLSQYLFNNQIEQEYLLSLKGADKQAPPIITIEVYLKDGPALFEGNNNLLKEKATGISLKIEFDQEYQKPYEVLVESGDELKSIPIEYYKITWRSFARDGLTAQSIPFKSAIIDSTATRFQNGSDIYISRIVRDELDDSQKVEISQAYRNLKEQFKENSAVIDINKKISALADISQKEVKIGVNLATKDAWEFGLTTFLDDVPFQNIGKGEQCIIKTNLSLGNKTAQKAGVILIEEPENHLSHSKLNQFIKGISNKSKEKQVIISTHDSFVANKLGLNNLILLHNQKVIGIHDLKKDTQEFFQKLPGYNTLRMLLSKKAILVEGDSDELIVQKAFMQVNNGQLPIEMGIDVISVGLTFKRFLFIAEKLDIPVAVVTDNDGKYDSKITKKYQEFDCISTINVFADNRNKLKTLEPQFVEANKHQLKKLCEVIGIDFMEYNTEDEISKKMQKMKTTWALRVFNTKVKFEYPDYINRVVAWSNE